ncbi:hypothetical protein [Methylobacterium brachiatum]|uniref:hypothetical protein n=1 Tax=Methylobacterium brachiatum TaxID=269660 RepID=UPI002449901C|nr:hypothetical protein [Methylobacterium brachiatum]MDH2313986.1 hypothetical protein [Methylobacterium brachiatum]
MYGPLTEWQQATTEARRALRDGFSSRQEIMELAAAAHDGPIRFADRLRQTEWGRAIDPAWTRDEYVMFVFGVDATFGDSYSTALLYAWQSVAPYVAAVH